MSRSIFVEPTEAQKGRLTSVTDIRSRFDPWRKKRAEHPGRSGCSAVKRVVARRQEQLSAGRERVAAERRGADAGFLAINITGYGWTVQRGILLCLSPCRPSPLSPSVAPTIDPTQWANTDTDDAPLFKPYPGFCNSNTPRRASVKIIAAAHVGTMSNNPADNGFVGIRLKTVLHGVAGR